MGKKMCPKCDSVDLVADFGRWFCKECKHEWTDLRDDDESDQIEDTDERDYFPPMTVGSNHG